MRKVVYSVAMSLDGYVAGPNGEADWITTDPENRASRRSLELAGAQFVEIVDVPMNCGIRIYGGKTRKCRYRL